MCRRCRPRSSCLFATRRRKQLARKLRGVEPSNTGITFTSAGSADEQRPFRTALILPRAGNELSGSQVRRRACRNLHWLRRLGKLHPVQNKCSLFLQKSSKIKKTVVHRIFEGYKRLSSQGVISSGGRWCFWATLDRLWQTRFLRKQNWGRFVLSVIKIYFERFGANKLFGIRISEFKTKFLMLL